MKYLIRTVLLAVALLCFTPFTVAQAYPDPGITIELDPDVCAGEDLPFSASSNVSGDWVVDYDERSATGSGASVAGTFTTEPADAGVARTLTATLDYPAGADYAAGQVSATTRVVLPSCDQSGPASSLPNTGGVSIGWLLAAVVLIVAGATAALRRRADVP